MTDEDPFVVVWEGPYLEGTMLVRALERSVVPVSRDEAAEPGTVRIAVPRSYVREASAILDAGPTQLVPDSPAELFEEPGGWRPPLLMRSRLALALLAAVLVLAILLAYR